MNADSYRLVDHGSKIEVVMLGTWEEETALAYARALEEVVRDRKKDPPNLVVDLSEIDGCTILARGVLADLQSTVAPNLARSVYVAGRPRIRGLCLWIAHVSDDPDMRVVRDLEQADEWLASKEARYDEVKNRLSSLVGGKR